MKKYDDTVVCFNKALKIFTELEAWEEAADAALKLGIEYLNPRSLGKAKQALQQAIDYYIKSNNTKNIPFLREALTRIDAEAAKLGVRL